MRAFLSEIGKHFAIAILYLALLTVAYIVLNGWNSLILFLWLGALIGAELPDFDHLIYAFLTYRDARTSREVRRLTRQKRYGDAFSYVAEHHKEFEPVHLLTHNCIMQTVFYAFAFCMVLFSRQYFWIGVGMSILLHLLKDEWEDLRNCPERLKAYLFRHFPHAPFSAARAYVLVATGLFVVLSILVVLPSS